MRIAWALIRRIRCAQDVANEAVSSCSRRSGGHRNYLEMAGLCKALVAVVAGKGIYVLLLPPDAHLSKDVFLSKESVYHIGL